MPEHHLIITPTSSSSTNALTCARVVGDVAHAVQVEARVEPLLSAEVHLGVVNIVHVDAHLEHLDLVLLVVGLHKDRLIPGYDHHPLGPVLGMPVPHVENYQVNDGSEGESEDKAADSDEKCWISAMNSRIVIIIIIIITS